MEDSFVLVTGATSGIGLATVRKLSQAKKKTLCMGRDEAALSSLEQNLAAGSLVRRLDLKDRSGIQALAEGSERFGALVLNAGIASPTPLDAPGVQAFEELLEVNLKAPLRLLRALLPRVVDGGRIVLVSSVLSRVGAPNLHGYCASKAGMNGLARALALDLAPRQITVNALCPTWVDTKMAARNIRFEAESSGRTEAEQREIFANRLPLQRFLSEDEVADWILWLLSPEASGMTGQAINLCLGMLATTAMA